MLSITVILVTFLVVLLIKWIRDRKYAMTTFKRMGISGPEPTFFLGNMTDFIKKGYKDTIREWTKTYGNIYGYYEGNIPVMVVGDPKLVKQIMVKDFNKFHSRKPSILVPENSPYEDLFSAEGEKWKRLRCIATPSFSTFRIKEMFPLISKSADDLMDVFEEHYKDGHPFDIHFDFGRLTTDVISSCAFGIDAQCLKNDDSEFFVKSKEVMGFFENLPLWMKMGLSIALMFPGLVSFIRKFRPAFFAFEAVWHLNVAKEILLARKSSKGADQRTDYVSLMLEANRQLEAGASLMPTAEDSNDLQTKIGGQVNIVKNPRSMNMEEMQGALVQFLLAGYETTGSALGFSAYRLAIHPNIQQKLQNEIDDLFPGDEILLNYNNIQKLKYMDIFMKEVLRIHPIVPIATTRVCFEEFKYENIIIPKGMNIQINMSGLHVDQELWGKYPTTDFVPERFEEDCQDNLNNGSWLPFGIGPRMCIGLRFAAMEYKVALARTLKKFSIKECTKTVQPCPTKTNGLLGPSKGVWVQLEKR